MPPRPQRHPQPPRGLSPSVGPRAAPAAGFPAPPPVRGGLARARRSLGFLGASCGRAESSVSEAPRGRGSGKCWRGQHRSQRPGHHRPLPRGRYRRSELRCGRRCMARGVRGTGRRRSRGLSPGAGSLLGARGAAPGPGSGASRPPAAPGSRVQAPRCRRGTERRERCEPGSERGSCSNPIPGAAAAAVAASATAGEVT